jgi:nucleotide-binding universal stress UspA family protein
MKMTDISLPADSYHWLRMLLNRILNLDEKSSFGTKCLNQDSGMKKIIAAFDGLRLSTSTMEYAIFLAQQSKAQLSGIFFSEYTRLGYAIYKTVIQQTTLGGSILDEISDTDTETVNESIHSFESACRTAGIDYSFRSDKHHEAKDLLHETMFADLLIIDADETFSYIERAIPSGFVKNILRNTFCPVIAVPRNFMPITEIAFLYDGSAASIHAIKMLDNTLPGMKKLKTKLFYAKTKNDQSALPDNGLLKEWLNKHFPRTHFKILEGTEMDIIVALAAEDPGILIVSGAYNRNNASMWFRHSFADKCLNDLKAPIFIAH